MSYSDSDSGYKSKGESGGDGIDRAVLAVGGAGAGAAYGHRPEFLVGLG